MSDIVMQGGWQKTPWWFFWRPRLRRWVERKTYCGGFGDCFNDSGWEYLP